MTLRGPEDDTPLVDYVTSKLWGNPEENKQYQVKITPIVGEYGVTRTFAYMHKWRSVPIAKRFYHIFTAGGLHPGYWNFINEIMRRSPFDRWIRVSSLSTDRGLQTDIYNAKGFQYSRHHAWVMKTNDGLTLIAVEKFKTHPVRADLDMYFRCYSPSQSIDAGTSTESGHNPFGYQTMLYESPQELATFTTFYNAFKAKPGFTGVYVNGVYFNDSPAMLPNLRIGDVVEIWHDPTVIRTEVYNFDSLMDFYSELDSKRKVILHPAKRKGDFRLRYFDDNDFFLIGTGKKGLYFHRNNVTTVRQLTHVDVSIADDAVRMTSEYLPQLNDVSKIKILVLVRETDWNLDWPHESQRVRYLYRMSDSDIMKAFTGARANMEEWTANKLEQGPVLSMIRSQFSGITRERAIQAVGYNAATRVLSENVINVTYLLGGRGIDVPVTYRSASSVWEYDASGHLLGYANITDSRYYSPSNPLCTKVEFTAGHYGRSLDCTVTNQDVVLNKSFDYRVYVSNWSTISNELVGAFTDVTDNEAFYVIENGTLVWTGLDKVNKRGIVITNRKSLAYSFELDHIDHSLSFDITHIYEPGGLMVPVSLAQVDLWLNNHPLIDNVDWIFKDQHCYIINKEFIKPGAQTITVRAHGFSEDMAKPKFETELGFVDGGVIGRFDRYHIRADRTTRTVINGALYLTDEVPRAEREVPDEQWDVLNGRPYMVKHVYTPILSVRDYKNYPLFNEGRVVDQKVTDYLTQYLPKPQTIDEEITWEAGSSPRPQGSGVPAIPNLQDKYRLFSPFMNVVVNGILNGLITLPALTPGDTAFSNQDVSEAVQMFTWWLEHDPVTLQFDRRYFAIMPYSNYEKLTVTDKEFLFIKQVNDLYLESVCSIEGHFEVNNHV